ncbi:MAG TPA: FAD-binding oxidoreductase [Flavisolibacter sp.]|nr:FAD-binding oxidoreductase [Flavisolibacter sp.]
MEETVPIISINQVTHNVRQYRVQKPDGYEFIPGQATELSINKPEWVNEKRPFSFTSLNADRYLEFTIKSYTDHDGVTNELFHLKEGDELIIRDVWGAISYKGEGYFIAGGAGITPFIAILRMLNKDRSIGDNRLLFSNRTEKDIILKDELTAILGNKAIFNVTSDQASNYDHSFMNEDYLRKHISDFSKNFYVCGPDKMITDINNILIKLGANPQAVVFEK